MLDCIISRGGHLIKNFRWTAMTFIQSEEIELAVDLAMLKQYARSSKSKPNRVSSSPIETHLREEALCCHFLVRRQLKEKIHEKNFPRWQPCVKLCFVAVSFNFNNTKWWEVSLSCFISKILYR